MSEPKKSKKPKKDHRAALEEWLERSARILDEYGTPPKNEKPQDS